LRLKREHIEKLYDAIIIAPADTEVEISEGKDGRITMMGVQIQEKLVPLSKIKNSTS